jgi:thiol:disulfide interchange protein DsbD
VSLQASWLVCATICVPEEGRFSLDIPAGDGSPSPQAALFRAAAERTPRPSPWSATLDPAGVLHVSGADLGPATVRGAWFAPGVPDRLDLSVEQRLRVSGGPAPSMWWRRPAQRRSITGRRWRASCCWRCSADWC